MARLSVGCTMCLLSSALGCGGRAEQPAPAGTVDIFSWWTAGAEADALQAVIDLHKERYPDVTVVNPALEDTTMVDLMRSNPPDLFQAIIGVDLLRWAGAQPKIEDLKSIVDENGWSFYDDLVKPGNLSDAPSTLYAVPVNIHRINSLFVNLKILTAHGIDPASLSTLDGFHAACDTLKTDPNLLAPLTIGSLGQWTLDILILENVLPAVAGGQFYEDYFRGKNTAPGTDPNIAAMLTETAKLWTYMPTGADSPNSVDWIPAIQYFIDGRVPFTVMGDWAKGFIDATPVTAGTTRLVAGVDYDEIPFPGTVGTFVYTTDAFALPTAATRRDLAIDFLDTFASDSAQVAFNAIKGSIPSRPLADVSGFDAVAQQTIAAYAGAADRRVALSAITNGAFNGPIYHALFDFVETCEAGTCDATLVTNALAANYGLLQ